MESVENVERPVIPQGQVTGSDKFLLAVGNALDPYIPGIADEISNWRFSKSNVDNDVRDKNIASKVSRYVSQALAQVDLDLDELNRVRDILDRYDLSSSVPSLKSKILKKKEENAAQSKDLQMKRSEIEIKGQKSIDDADHLDNMDDQYRLFVNVDGSKANRAVKELQEDLDSIDYNKVDKPIINTLKEEYRNEK